MRNLLALALLLSARCEAGALRKNEEGFEVVGGGVNYEPFSHEGYHRTLTNAENVPVEKEAVGVTEFMTDESVEYVDPESGRRQQSTSCGSDEQSFQLTFKTDAYGEETSYTLEKRNANGSWTKVDFGPKNNKKYEGKTEYNPTPTCVAGGKSYRLTIMDAGGDGMCCKFGKGYFQYALDGDVKYSTDYESTFTQKVVKNFVVSMPSNTLPVSGRNSVCGSGKQLMHIELQLDQFGNDDNSWELRSLSNNQVIKSADIGDYKSSGRDELELCLDDGKYRFTLFDRAGDGICCQKGKGYYKFHLDGTLIIDERYFNTGTKVSHDIIVGYGKNLSLTSREQAYLDAHNWRRKKYHADYNVDFVPLMWSKGLTQHAASWAEKLLDDCDVVGVKHEPGVEQGENLAKNAGQGTWGELYPVENIVRRWVDREETWEWPHNAHFTQALWKSSNYVGCAESTKNMANGGTCHVQVCRYARSGNCNMAKWDPQVNNGWKTPMLMDENPCGPACPPEGCFCT